MIANLSNSLRRSATILLIGGLGAVAVACSPATESPSDGTIGGGTVAVVDGAVELSADELAFDASTIEAPAGEEFTVTLNNLESQPHNVSVYAEEGGEEIVTGEIVTGPDQSVDVVVPALDPGEYFFVCDVHATVDEMKGTIVVGEPEASG